MNNHSGGPLLHETAIVEGGAVVGSGTRVWHHAHLRAGSRVGAHCILGKNVYVDTDVTLGDNVKVQNNSSLYRPLRVDDGVFIGPHVVFTNDRVPRAVNPDGTPKSDTEWVAEQSHVGRGASIGAGSVILPGISIGPWAMIGAGSVVTRNVPAHGVVVGNPARLIGYVCHCGHRLHTQAALTTCSHCGASYRLEEGVRA